MRFFNDDGNEMNLPLAREEKKHKVYPTRFARMLEKLFGGQFVTLETVSDNITPVVDVTRLPTEELILSGEKLCNAYTTIGADVANGGYIWLWDGVEKALATVEKAWAYLGTAGIINFFITAQDVVSQNNLVGTPNDARFIVPVVDLRIPKHMLSLRSSNNGTGPAVGNLTVRALCSFSVAANEKINFIDYVGEQVLVQGTGLLVSGPANVALTAGFSWRERQVETNEEYSGV